MQIDVRLPTRDKNIHTFRKQDQTKKNVTLHQSFIGCRKKYNNEGVDNV
jgi:hypothetical protein